MEVGFELRSQHKDGFAGGTVPLANGKAFDLGRAIKQAKGGVITTSDPELAARLAEVEALKQVKVPDSKQPSKGRKDGES